MAFLRAAAHSSPVDEGGRPPRDGWAAVRGGRARTGPVRGTDPGRGARGEILRRRPELRLGHYPQPPPLPILGNEIAGDVGGRRVLAFVRASGGGCAEKVAVDDEWIFDLPDGAGYAEGASLLTTYLTA